MKNKVITVLTNWSTKKTSTQYKAISLIIGAIIFLIVFPVIFVQIGRLIEKYILIHWNTWHEILLTIVTIPLGISILFWTAFTQWVIGKGTPAPNAPTQKLIIVGPYMYCRNPIELGAIIYYLGIGTYFASLTTGFVSGVLGLIIGSLYHKLIEEKELELRFGNDYIEYKKTTPFLFPKIRNLLILLIKGVSPAKRTLRK
ncbi:MAG: protein-S-isoprenylcysteine O-methyltransferase-like protein [Firmicutes bacterium]|nr:protein-S-isoprenylcysteine O-methyltransferase-like protein [Bacillota bacterium]